MKKPMAIISSYFGGETYGILGPQMAATIISENTNYNCIVIAVARNDDKYVIKKGLEDYFGNERPVIGFSTLSGREDLFSLGRELKKEGAVTVLAGPQSGSDYIGERNWEMHPHRFHGLSKSFSFALHGPGEQAIRFLDNLDKKQWDKVPGLFYLNRDGKRITNSEKNWDDKYLRSIDWSNIYRIGLEGIVPIKILMGQVLQQIGCPYASKESWTDIDYPVSLKGQAEDKIRVRLKGCSFCDVAADKGFYGELDMETVLDQILCLPDDSDGRKIPFELINENPLFRLPDLILQARTRNIMLSQVNLILRADWFLKGEARLRAALWMAKDMGVRIFASSIGFEAFDDTLLRNFHKGTDVETNLRAISLMRRLKEEFPQEWGYSRAEGAVHGFIHPTPWDTDYILNNTKKNIAIYGLERDIIPPNSTPLIIHHASALGDWIREVEKRKGVAYRRYGSVIGWWKSE